MQSKHHIIFGLLIILTAVLQTTVLVPLQIQNVRPDFVLLFLIFFAHQVGSFPGMLIGFIAGIILDSLGISPLGFHSFLYTLIGYLFGATRGKVFVDGIAMPLLLAFVSSLIVFILSFLLIVVFLPGRLGDLFSIEFLLQVGSHVILAPFIFGILRLFRLSRERETQML